MNKHNRSYASPRWIAELKIKSLGEVVFCSVSFPTRIGLCAALLRDLPTLYLSCSLADLELVFTVFMALSMSMIILVL